MQKMSLLAIALSLVTFTAIANAEESYVGADHATYTTKDYDAQKTPLYRVSKLIVPKDLKARVAAGKKIDRAKMFAGDLPKKFDWRVYGVGPIRNQGNCGSCWAFSMTATLTDVVYLKKLGPIDLSEQLLVSCDKGNSGCNGGWMEEDFFKSYGSTLESNFPYVARDVACKQVPFIHKIANWKYVDGDGVADTELLKRAIYTWGPASVAVAAVGDFGNYSGGIYNGSTSGQLNHAVNIVGWDDTVSPGHWIMRNSWSESWGEQGWMRIAYKSRGIGSAATVIDYDGKELTPDQPVPPTPPTPPVPPTPPTPPTPPAPPCPPCEPCTFWNWISQLFS